MPAKARKRKVTSVTSGTIKQTTRLGPDLANCSPEWLRDRVLAALKRLSREERESLRDRVLSDLKKAGVNIASGLFKLGILAMTPDELTPSDIAKLVRYVRINTPGAMGILGGTLNELIAREHQKPVGVKPLKEAA